MHLKTLILQLTLATGAVLFCTPLAFADVADDSPAGGDDTAGDDDDGGKCSAVLGATTLASLGLGGAVLIGLRRREQ